MHTFNLGNWLVRTAMISVGFYLVATSWTASAAPALTIDQEQWIEDHLQSGDLIGLVVVSIDRDSEQFFSFGHTSAKDTRAPNESAQFEIGSITKAFTNLLLAELVTRGKLDYDTTIADVMTDLEFENPDIGRITLLELATHTSGLPRLPANMILSDNADPYADYDTAALRTGLQSARPGQELSKTYAYSNFGMGLLGHLLGIVEGGGYVKALKTHVLMPLGMETANFEDGEALVPGHHAGQRTSNWHLNALAGAGGLRASGLELARVFRPWLTEGTNALHHDVSADLEIAAATDTRYMKVTRVWHVVEVGDVRVFWHSGGTGGYRSFVGFNPSTGQGRVVLSNTDYDVTEFGLGLLAVERPEVAAAAQNHTGDGQDTYSDYHGHFAITPGFVLSIFQLRGQLVLQATGQQPVPLASSGEDRFNVSYVDAQLVFERDESGTVQRAILHQNGQIMPAERVDAPATIRTFTENEIEIDEDTLSIYEGEYDLAPGTLITVTRDGSKLLVRLEGQPKVRVFPFETDRFFYKVVNAQLTFNRKNGEIVSLTLHQNGIDQIVPRR